MQNSLRYKDKQQLKKIKAVFTHHKLLTSTAPNDVDKSSHKNISGKYFIKYEHVVILITKIV